MNNSESKNNMLYKDFIIEIESKQGEDYIINIRSPAGEGSSRLRLPFELDDAADMLQNLAGTFRSASSPIANKKQLAKWKWKAPPRRPLWSFRKRFLKTFLLVQLELCLTKVSA